MKKNVLNKTEVEVCFHPEREGKKKKWLNLSGYVTGR